MANLRPASEALRAPTMATARPREAGGVAVDGEQRRRAVDVAGARPDSPARRSRRGARRPRPRRASSRSASLDGAMPDAPAAALGEARAGVERRRGAAEAVDQVAEGDRADVLAADQAQPGEPLLVGEARRRRRARRVHRCCPILRFGAGEQAARCCRQCAKPEDDGQDDEEGGRAPLADDKERDRRDERSRSAPQRRIAGQRRRRASQTTAKTSAAGQDKADQHAEIGGDALAALEAEPDRKEMAEEGAEAGDERRRSAAEACRRCRTAAVPFSASSRQRRARRGPCGRCAAHWWRRYCRSRSCGRRRGRRSA